MRAKLIDIDSRKNLRTGQKFPNLALMKISTYHKQRGDVVGFDVEDPDWIYISCIFKKNSHKVDELLDTLKANHGISIGGPGRSYRSVLPDEMEFVVPDYSLYPYVDFSMGFTTRGCNRKCKFCIVPIKEGKHQRWQHPSEFHNPAFKKIMIMDNNWFMDKDWFFETSAWIVQNKLRVLENGMDFRLLDKEIAHRLAQLKWAGPLHFAFDDTTQATTTSVLNGIQLLKSVGINVRRNVRVYVYMDGSSDKDCDDAIWRCRTLKAAGVTPLLMYNIDAEMSQRAKNIRRWASKHQVFWKVDIDDYIPGHWKKEYEKGIQRQV